MRAFKLLKESVQHGLTQQQANQIFTKMTLIQRVYLTPEEVPEDAALKEEKD